jgi:hypothetical protein
MARGVDRRAVEINLPWTSNGAKAKLARTRRDPMAETRNEDLATAAAIGVIAAGLATIAHEAAGHGGACLAHGGQVLLLSNVYFRCAPPAPIVDLAGPLGNLALALIALLALTLRKTAGVAERLFLSLLFAFSAFWLAGLLLVCGLTGEGDAAFWARDALSMPSTVWRPVMTILGAGLYVVAIVTTARLAPPGPAWRARIAWLAGAFGMALTALAYKGSPLAGDVREAVVEAVKEIALASLPLWFLAKGLERRAEVELATPPLTRGWPWIIAAVIGLSAFVVTMGRGLP